MNPDQGPGLAFVTLPEIFVRMTGGQTVGIAFFGLLVLAAITSSVALLDIPVAYAIERWRLTRTRATLSIGAHGLRPRRAEISRIRPVIVDQDRPDADPRCHGFRGLRCALATERSSHCVVRRLALAPGQCLGCDQISTMIAGAFVAPLNSPCGVGDYHNYLPTIAVPDLTDSSGPHDEAGCAAALPRSARNVAPDY